MIETKRVFEAAKCVRRKKKQHNIRTAACDIIPEGQVNTNEVKVRIWNPIMAPSS